MVAGTIPRHEVEYIVTKMYSDVEVRLNMTAMRLTSTLLLRFLLLPLARPGIEKRIRACLLYDVSSTRHEDSRCSIASLPTRHVVTENGDFRGLRVSFMDG